MCRVLRLLALLAVAVVLATARAVEAAGAPSRPWWGHGFIVFKCGDVLCLLKPGTESGALLGSPNRTPWPQWDPALSSDGRYLALRGYYTPFAEGNYALYIRDLGRGTWRRVTRKGSIAADPAWSPDGRWLAFDTSGVGEIRKVRAAGGRPVPLTHQRNGGDSFPAWSPDGRRIAFVHEAHGRGQVWVMRADGRDAHLLHADRRLSDAQPAWSHDGTRLALVATRGRRSKIEVMSASGGDPRVLTGSRLDAWNPVWLPHDAGIAFLASDDGAEAGNLFVMRPGGGGVHRLTHWHGRFRTAQFAWVGARMKWGRC